MDKDVPTKEKNEPLNTITIGTMQSELVQRHGEAASQIVQAYTGHRYDSAGTELLHKGRSLEQISNYKINPDYKKQNIKQQAGFAAELLEESNRNRDAILSGSPVRKRTTDGIGKTNDTKYDLVDVDASGNISNPSQMKFLQADAKGHYAVIDKLAKDSSWDRYDTVIDVPSDQYEAAKKYAQEQAKKAAERAQKLHDLGKHDQAIACEEKAERYRRAGDRIRQSSVTEDDAILARLKPKTYVAKSLLKDAHNAGKEAAAGAVLIGGAISIGQNICSVCSGEVSIEEAAKSVVKTTATAGVTTYGVTATGSTIKALMHSSGIDVIRKLGNTSLPTAIVTSSMEIFRTVKRYAAGELTEGQALAELGKGGAGNLAATYGAAVGTVLLPGIGTAVGSMVGYMISAAIYDSCLQVAVEADLAHENYLRVSALCSEARESMRRQRLEFEKQTAQLIQQRGITITQSMSVIMNSLESQDTEDFTYALRNLAESFGRELQFRTFEEFDTKMQDEQFVLIF